jgi:hypothetical protein
MEPEAILIFPFNLLEYDYKYNIEEIKDGKTLAITLMGGYPRYRSCYGSIYCSILNDEGGYRNAAARM